MEFYVYPHLKRAPTISRKLKWCLGQPNLAWFKSFIKMIGNCFYELRRPIKYILLTILKFHIHCPSVLVPVSTLTLLWIINALISLSDYKANKCWIFITLPLSKFFQFVPFLFVLITFLFLDFWLEFSINMGIKAWFELCSTHWTTCISLKRFQLALITEKVLARCNHRFNTQCHTNWALIILIFCAKDTIFWGGSF